jgi:hypothetical protein
VDWVEAFGLYIVGGDANSGTTPHRIQTSPDGINWISRVGSGAGGQDQLSGGYSPDLNHYSSGGVDAGNNSLSSTNGIDWTVRNRGQAGPRGGPVWSSAESIFVETPIGAPCHTSTDGLTWTQRNNPTGTTYAGVAWSPSLGQFRAAGGSGIIIGSDDGITWATIINSASDFQDIKWSETQGLYCAVGGASGAVVETSSNGDDWTDRDTAGTTRLNHCAYSERLDLWIAVGDNGTIEISDDAGVTDDWTDEGIGGTDDFLSIAA